MTNSPIVVCRALQKNYGLVCAVESVDFTLERGSFTALLGPSGCGKTTVLRMIAGLERPDRGEIILNGRPVNNATTYVAANQRQVGMVFQDYALFPHMTVAQNVAYGLLRGGDKHSRVRDMLDLVGLHDMEKRYPHELSGGQQQRVALARALAPQPDILLLDEPFSNLDVSLRVQVREEVHRILQDANVTAILVTHDQDEAMSLASQIGLMFDGTIVQFGTPHELYGNPVSRRAAQFLGEVNVLSGNAHGDTATTAIGTIPLQHDIQGAVDVLIRPEHLTISATDSGTPAHVVRQMYFGTYCKVWLALPDATPLTVRCAADQSWPLGTEVAVNVEHAALAFPAET